VMASLNGHGIGRGDRVAIVLSNGPEMAAAFLSIGACAATAPLSPAYREEEFTFYLADLKAKALVIAEGLASPPRAAARALHIPIIDLIAGADRPAGTFMLRPAMATGSALRPGPAETEDTALILHTSGTTSRPKIVPLSQRNIVAAARAIGRTLHLGV